MSFSDLAEWERAGLAFDEALRALGATLPRFIHYNLAVRGAMAPPVTHRVHVPRGVATVHVTFRDEPRSPPPRVV